MRIFKNLISLALITALLITSIPFSANAENAKGKIYPFVPEVNSYYKEVKDYIADALRERQATIDISQFGIPKEDIIYIYRSVMFDNPDIFYVNSAYVPFKFNNYYNYIAYLSPQYIFTQSKLPSYIKKFDAACEKYISGIDSSWSDMKKALVLHDRIIAGCKYKYQNLKSFTAYSALVTGKSICEGYTRAYSYLLSLVGVDSKCINNESGGHCWNLVKLGGSWYHVDVTSDDPTPDTIGYVRHKYFLVSTKKLLAYNTKTHAGFKKDVTYASTYNCTSSKYNSAFFRNITSQIVYYKNAFYYFDNDYKGKHISVLYKRKGSSKKKLKVIKDVWRDSRGNRIYGSYCYLCEAEKYIFFNSKRKIFRYNISTGKIKRIMTLPSVKTMNFVGIQRKDYTIRTARLNASKTVYKIVNTIKLSEKYKPSVIPFLKYSSYTHKKGKYFLQKLYYAKGDTVYKSSNKKVANVSSAGWVKGRKKGSCTITALNNGKKYKCKVKVIG